MTTSNPEEILEFWYSERIRKRWFDSTPVLDAEIKEKYEATWEHALAGELDD